MIRRRSFALLSCTVIAWLPQTVSAKPDVAVSARLQGWSGDRLGRETDGTINAEVWAKVEIPVGESISLRAEAWAGTDPRGGGQAGADLREGLIEARVAGVKLSAGRQLLSWGRADRINPTDMLAARDYARLVEEEDETRLGQAALTLGTSLGGGTATAYWVPEFRPTALPFQFSSAAIPVVMEKASDSDSYALRYERFGSPFDFSVTFADGPDRTPWLALGTSGGAATLQLKHPRVRTVGADLATTIGNFGVRLEVAHYSGWKGVSATLSPRTPRYAAVLGVDRSLPGGWMLIAQGILRISSKDQAVNSPSLPVSDRNASIHGAWRKTIAGATLSIRKSFAADRGRAELTGAWLSGGGRFLQGRASFSIGGDVRLQILGEHFDGPPGSYFGRLNANNIVMLGLRVGY